MVGEPLQGHTNPVLAAGYSYDGTRIVSSSADSTIRIWDAYTGRMLGEPLQGHTNAVRSVGYSHDGTRIVSGSEDKTIRTWDARAGQILDGTLNDYSTSVLSVNPKAHPGQPASDAPIELGPTPPNCPTVNSHAYWRLADDGWVLGSHSNLLVWVPPELRDCLLYPQNLVMISTRGSLALDFSHAQLGDNWSHCYRIEHDLPLQ
ncbi:WD40 repeat-like protein [Ceratobasidium sp. AG-I]|nr:WD40 repeat-like protein [Ceratobasidium sp. AG-I]